MPKETVELKVHPNWVALIRYCEAAHQNGPLTFETQGAVPVELLEPSEEKIKFGKDSKTMLFSKDITEALVQVRVTKKWSGLIDFCAQSFPYGQVSVKMAAGEPVEPIGKYTKAKIRFDHAETIPQIVRFFDTPASKSR